MRPAVDGGRLADAESGFLRSKVDVGVPICRRDVNVAQPSTNDVELDSGLEQMNGGCMTAMSLGT
jgi:hypothetical protein